MVQLVGDPFPTTPPKGALPPDIASSKGGTTAPQDWWGWALSEDALGRLEEVRLERGICERPPLLHREAGRHTHAHLRVKQSRSRTVARRVGE